ncbi:hypothetical protein EZV62_012295 [Acer yangbiense]|uniref:Cation/H+ exchanger transmembrane domain-containing protein n=1 Tax=Acer yangbiense TaxID=1000413 RepID=A0A5C7HXP9_9ROSI|nr:hypothetical protein EZV62_012295 [Acer yangbiense]
MLPRFELQIVAAFSVSQAFHFLLKRFGIPTIVSQIIAGVILGFNLDPENIMSSFTSLDILDMVSAFGFILFIFLMGVKMDVTMIHRTGKKTLYTAILCLVVPFLLGLVAVERVCAFWDLDSKDRRKLIVVVVAQCPSTLPVIACIISELKILNSELGRLGLSCGIVSDMICLILSMATIWVMSIYRKSAKAALIDLAAMVAYIAVAVFVIRPAMIWVVKQTPEGKPVKSLFINNIIILAFYLTCLIITEGMFRFLFLTVLVTATAVPVLVKYLYDPSRKYAGYQKRNIMHSKGNSELRILACIYWPDNIPAIISFLQASTPTRESPVAVYVLHLINLSGRDAPLFISHKMQMKTISYRSYSKNVSLSFSCFEENNGGTVSVHPFTAISPHKLMHEDVCTLALNKLTSLAVLPFHLKWFIDEFTSRELSLGSSFSVAMIFFGDSDDRVALTLAKHMRQNANISLTIVRFITKKNEISTDWEKVLDSEVLKDIKPGSTINERLKYTMEKVNDGEETLSKIQSMAWKHDLIIVGRRNNVETTPQTSG